MSGAPRDPTLPLVIDGRETAPVGTLLDAARALAIPIPSFCHDHRLSPGGECRSCLVELDGRLVPACSTRAEAGGVVRTATPEIAEYRRDLGELMRSESDPGGEVGETLSGWGVRGDRYPRPGGPSLPRPADEILDLLRFDASKCILCRRCVRTCEEIQGRFVWAVHGRGAGAHVAFEGPRLADSDCVACGACAESCPSSALSSGDPQRAEAARAAGASEPTVRTTCGYCGVGCGLDVHVADGRIVRVEGADSPVNHGHLCVKGRHAHAFTSHPERLTTPWIRRAGRLEPASWDEAIGFVARELARLRGSVAGLSSARATNEENYLFQKWLRGGLGTNDVDCCARVCHAPSAIGMRESLGTGAATNSLADIERADLLVVVGANPTEAHPVTGARILQAALRGAGLIVVDPRRTELAALADVHLAPRPGTNVPLLNALAAELLELGAVDREFVARRTEGWDALERFLRDHPADAAETVTGVARADLKRAAARLASARRPMFLHGLGVTEHLQGSEAVRLLCNLALMLGAIGREGVGVNPLRGQNNVQGAADMGCAPDLLPGYAPVADPAARARFAEAWGREVPATPGRTLPRMWDAIRAGEIRGLLVFGEDLLQTEPESLKVRAALESLELLVVQELFLSETAKLAHVVLPAASGFEKDGTYTSGERRIQRVRAAIPPPGEAKADWQILIALMGATGWPQTSAHPSEVFDEIAKLVPAFAGASYQRLEGDGLQWPVPHAGHPGTPILHQQDFPIGRARFACVEYRPSPETGSPLTLVTGRVLEHYNSGSMTRRTSLLERVRADQLEMHPDDARDRGLADRARVRVTSRHGWAVLPLRITRRVPRGTVFTTFHFPESGTNRLVGPTRDRGSDCPEYKVTAVEVSRAES